VEANVKEVLQTDSSRELETQKRKLQQNCQEFESVMISFMMKTMRDSTIRGEEPGNAMGIYEDMMFGQVSKEISSSSALGLGDMLYSQLEPLIKIHVPKEGDHAAGEAQTAVSQPQSNNQGTG
jgi:Rod binding domain-containing protein